MEFFNFLMFDVLSEPAVLVGLIALIGLIAQKKPVTEIVSQEGPMDVSNVMLVHNGKTTKIGYKVVDGKKVRVARATGEVID